LVVALGACARTGSNGAVFDAIVAERPDLYLALGDLHYSNLESTDPGDHIAAYGHALGQPGQAALFSSIPTAYVWDDHDYGPNDSTAASAARPAVSTAYRQAVPHYGVDPDTDQSIAQAFTVGRVRVVFSDTRSLRTASSMLGPEQQAWLIEELTSSSQTHALVIWVNPTPWIGAANAGADDWSAYPDDRRAIAGALAEAEVENLVMVSGDAHMVAIDDGTNSGYAEDGSGGFPVLHAAALDRPGSTKGGPYSHGAFPGSGQYGVVEVDDGGGATIGVRLSGRTWSDEELVELALKFDAPPQPDRGR
ncbi:MAG: alkaline phosphatase D family protein, partial [Acidimicrobiales bacterium]